MLCRPLHSFRRGRSADGGLSSPGTTPSGGTLCQKHRGKPCWNFWNMFLKVWWTTTWNRISFGCNRCGVRPLRWRQTDQRTWDREPTIPNQSEIHNVFTRFPKYPKCQVCRMTKTTRDWCKNRLLKRPDGISQTTNRTTELELQRRVKKWSPERSHRAKRKIALVA